MDISITKNYIEMIFNDVLNQVDSAECFYSELHNSSFSIRANKIDSKNISNTRGIGLRIIKDNCLGHAYTTDFTKNGFQNLIKNALLNHKYQEKNYPISFQSIQREDRESNLDLSFRQTSFENKFEVLVNLEEKILGSHENIAKIEQTNYSQVEYFSYLENSNRYSSYSDGSVGSISTMLLAQKDMQEESGSGGLSVKRFSDFNLDKIAQEAIFDATKLLGAKKLKGYKGMAVFSKDMAVTLISLIAQSFKGNNIYKKKSLFETIGEKCAPSFFNLVDDATLKNGFSTYLVDSEGERGQKNLLIKNGRVNEYLFDRYYAKLLDKASTGNGLRDGYSDIPYVGFSNLFVENDKYTLVELLNIMNKGIYITDILGAHTANPITGDFSFGISGICIENGQYSIPFRGATISGNLKDLLKNIVALGNDNDYSETITSPSILIDGLSIVG